jgi:purine-binding chemotaxis protein CheW
MQTSTELNQFFGFFVAGEEYAIGILRVKEIREYETVTRVPKTPPWIRGVMNLRGSVVPVVDLAVKFGLPETAITKRTCIVVVEVDLDDERTVMGVMADAVSQVLDLGPDDIKPAPAFGTRVNVDYLVGMGQVGAKFILVLDIDKVLSTSELLAAASLAAPEDAALAEGAAQEARAESVAEVTS